MAKNVNVKLLKFRVEGTIELLDLLRKEEADDLKKVLADCCGGEFEFDEDSELYCVGHTHEFDFPVEFRVEKVAIEDEEIRIYASPILGGEPYEQMKMPAYKFMPGQIMKITERIFYGWLDIQDEY